MTPHASAPHNGLPTLFCADPAVLCSLISVLTDVKLRVNTVIQFTVIPVTYLPVPPASLRHPT